MEEGKLYRRFRLRPYRDLSQKDEVEALTLPVRFSSGPGEGEAGFEIPVTLGSRQTRYWLPRDIPEFETVLTAMRIAEETGRPISLLVNERRLAILGLAHAG